MNKIFKYLPNLIGKLWLMVSLFSLIAIYSFSSVDNDALNNGITAIQDNRFAYNFAGWLGAMESNILLTKIGILGAWSLIISSLIGASIVNIFQRSLFLLALTSGISCIMGSIIGIVFENSHSALGEIISKPIIEQGGLGGVYIFLIFTSLTALFFIHKGIKGII